MNALTEFAQQFRAAWLNSSVSQRLVLVGAIGFVLAGLGSIIFMTGRADMAVLYSELSPTDAGAVVEALAERNIPHKVSTGGDTVRVPRQRVAETRLVLAQAGLPAGAGLGFELFDRNEFGITDFAQKVNFKRATEGELARTINYMQEVKFSRVQLVMPQRRLFGRDQAETTAAVFLFLRPGRSLARTQVQAIQHLVSSGVENLSPHNITITDQYAHALAAPRDPADSAALSATQLEVRANVERSLARKVQTILDRVVGPGRSAVAVTAELDFDRVERSVETFNPDGQVVRSEQRQSEKSSATEPGLSGAVGVTANLPTATNAGAGGGSGSTKKSDTTITNYEIDTTVERIVKAPGTVKALSVSVVVDGTYTAGEDGEDKTYQARSAEEMANLKRLVVAAVGNGPAATVEVLNVPLDTSVQAQDVAARDAARQQRYIDVGMRLAYYAVILIGALVAFNFARRMVAAVADATQASAPAPAPASGSRLDLLSGDMTDAELQEAQLVKMSEDRPEDMAMLIKTWLAER